MKTIPQQEKGKRLRSGKPNPRLLIGDISGIQGNLNGVWGRAEGLCGEVGQLLEQGLLWPKNQSLNLEMFACRYGLSMECLDTSGFPALVAFHPVEDRPLHWLSVRPDCDHGFIVGPLDIIRKRFPNQEIAKVAVPADAQWQVSHDLEFISVDRFFVLEHTGQMVGDVAW